MHSRYWIYRLVLYNIYIKEIKEDKSSRELFWSFVVRRLSGYLTSSSFSLEPLTQLNQFRVCSKEGLYDLHSNIVIICWQFALESLAQLLKSIIENDGSCSFQKETIAKYLIFKRRPFLKGDKCEKVNIFDDFKITFFFYSQALGQFQSMLSQSILV